MIDLNILGIEGVSLSVPQCSEFERTPEKTMHNAKRRYAGQGAERITLVPNRNGDGWVKKVMKVKKG